MSKPATVYGLDFTSAPSSTPLGASAKRLTLAECQLDGSHLVVKRLIELNGKGSGNFSEVENWLNSRLPWEDDKHWIAGIDFPFGMPIAAIERFNWLRIDDKTQTWETYIDRIYELPDLQVFQAQVESWTKQNYAGEEKRVFILRHTDRVGGFGGANPSSPMKIHPGCNPAVGRMFFQGARCLRNSEVCVWPIRVNDCPRIVIEAYPRIVADKFIGADASSHKYKDAFNTTEIRNEILTGLSRPNHDYEITLTFLNDNDRLACVNDQSGDLLDSVLCATQAAWSWHVEQAESVKGCVRTQRFGIPVFATACLNQQVALEGWIADPLLLKSVRPAPTTARSGP